MTTPWWDWTEFESDGRKYRARLTPDLTIIEAEVSVSYHDKASTWRALRNPVTLERLQGVARPPPACPACGQPIKGATP